MKKTKLKPEQVRMQEAVAYLQKYMATYDKQMGYLDYQPETYITDVLYGLGASLGKEYEFAGGFEKFMDRLLEHLNKMPRRIATVATP